jgi:hypothetical protein
LERGRYGLDSGYRRAVHNYAEKRALAEHHKQYKRMKTVFQRARNALPDLIRNEDMANARALLGDLGKEALAEHGDWLMLHRERPIELPKAEI